MITQDLLKARFYYKDGGLYYLHDDTKAGHQRKDGYAVVAIDKKRYLEHRLIWQLTFGDQVPKVIDHADRNPSNNSLDNLRAATKAQNCVNSKLRPTNTSGFRGVVFNRKNGNWTAQLRRDGYRHRKYGYQTAVEAARAYDDLALEHHGKFAVLNFPKEKQCS